jgi:hypothetical protein
MNTLFVAVAVAAGLISQGVPQGTSPDISGTWELSITTPRGVESATLTLKGNGDKFSGTAARATQPAPAEATVKDTAVTIIVTAPTQTYTFSGEVAGDTMSGTADLGGARSSAPWSAKRKAEPSAADVTGTWAVEVETGQGTGTPTFTFKQEGNKLSGQYRGLFGEAPVTGTIDGSAIVFSVDATVEGNTVRVTYSGTVDKDTMKGAVKFGDLAEGTFKGTRKP